MTLTLESPAFGNREKIPAKFTGDGADISPELRWTGLPERTREFALICDDPDAPTSEPWVHWLIYKLPHSLTGLPENVAKTPSVANPAGALQGANSWRKIGYGGPAPPHGHGIHHYHFKLYALHTPLGVTAGLDKKGLVGAMRGHILAEAELIGTYQR
jgi:hypothetical protein